MARALLLIGLWAASALAGTGFAGAAELLRVRGNIIKWVPPSSGLPIVVTYAALTAPLVVSGDRRTLSPDNCGGMHAFADIVTKSPAVSVDLAKTQLRAAFAAWERAADITFVEVTDAGHADIIVGAANAPFGRAFANLSYRGARGGAPAGKALAERATDLTVTPTEATSVGGDGFVVAIEQAFVCLNPGAPWKVGFDGTLDVYDLRYTFTHEIGHAIGLDHPGGSGALMGYRYDERLHELQPSDIATAQQLYGASRRAK